MEIASKTIICNSNQVCFEGAYMSPSEKTIYSNTAIGPTPARVNETSSLLKKMKKQALANEK